MKVAGRSLGQRLRPGAPPAPRRAGDATRPADSASDNALLAAMGAGDPDAALAFVRRFERTAFGVALTTLGDIGLAEDVAQQAFEQAWRQASHYDSRRGTVRSWLVTIVHNLAVDTARIRRPTPVAPLELTQLITAITLSPEHNLLAGETTAELAAALRELPPEQARAAVMAAAYGYTAREIALVEGIPLGSAKSRIRLALAKLHAAIPRRAPDD